VVTLKEHRSERRRLRVGFEDIPALIPAQERAGTNRRGARLSWRLRRTKTASSNEPSARSSELGNGGRQSAEVEPIATPANGCSRLAGASVREAEWARTCRHTCRSPREAVVATQHHYSSDGPRFWPGTAAGRIRSDRGQPGGWRSVAHRHRPPLRSSEPAHWCPRQSQGAAARGLKVQPARAGRWSSAIQPVLSGSELPASRGASSNVDPHLTPRKPHALRPGQPNLRTADATALGTGDLPLLVIELVAASAESSTLALGLGITVQDRLGRSHGPIACLVSATSRVICLLELTPIVRKDSPSSAAPGANGRWGEGLEFRDEMR